MKSAYHPQSFVHFGINGRNDPMRKAKAIANDLAHIVGCMGRLLVEKLPAANAMPAWTKAWWFGKTFPLTPKDITERKRRMHWPKHVPFRAESAGAPGIARFIGQAHQNLPTLFAPPFSQNPADPGCLANRITAALGRPTHLIPTGQSRTIDLDYVRETIAEITVCWRELYSIILSMQMKPKVSRSTDNDDDDDLRQSTYYVQFDLKCDTLAKAHERGRLKKSEKRNGRWYHSESEVRATYPEQFT